MLRSLNLNYVLHELWVDPFPDGLDLFTVSGRDGDDARASLSAEARLVWAVEASSHFDAMTRYYEYRGLGVYTTDQEWDYQSYADHGWEVSGRENLDLPLAELLTVQLRGSQDPSFSRLREELTECGLDLSRAVLADFFDDDVDQDIGVLITGDKSVLTFVMHHGRKGDLNTQIATARIHELIDITSTWRSSRHRDEVSSALAVPRFFPSAYSGET